MDTAPEPNAEALLCLIAIRAMLAAEKPRKRLRVLRIMGEMFGDPKVTPIHVKGFDKARALFTCIRPSLLRDAA